MLRWTTLSNTKTFVLNTCKCHSGMFKNNNNNTGSWIPVIHAIVLKCNGKCIWLDRMILADLINKKRRYIAHWFPVRASFHSRIWSLTNEHDMESWEILLIVKMRRWGSCHLNNTSFLKRRGGGLYLNTLTLCILLPLLWTPVNKR